MKVLKFGGSSVATPERIRGVIDIVKSALQAETSSDHIAVVVSAFGGVTDLLLQASLLAQVGNDSYKKLIEEFETRHNDAVRSLVPPAKQNTALLHLKLRFNELEDVLHGVFLLRERSAKSLDLILSFGERLSAYIISQAFIHAGTEAFYVDSRGLVRTNKNYGNAIVGFDESYVNIRTWFKEKPAGIPIITGFIASAADGTTTTLGRGGSDYTASIFGGALVANEIQIWTDVDGVMSADPRRVNAAFVLPEISYDEAMEMSHSGAKVLHPHTVVPAMEHNIPVRIKNTFNPHFDGTLISRHTSKTHFVGSVKGISSINRISLVSISGSGMMGMTGVASRLFGAMARAGINIILISQPSSEQSISFAINPQFADNAKAAIEQEFALELDALQVEKITIRENLAVLAVIGENMCGTPGISAKLFEALGKNGINVIAVAQGANEMNISIVIEAPEEDKALNSIHEAFFLSRNKIHLFLVGTGIIGKSLLRQMHEQCSVIAHDMNLELHLNAIANSRKMLVRKDGIAFDECLTTLDASGEPTDLKKLVADVKALKLHNCIFVDCTASDDVAVLYPEILNANISVVTPNKRANSGSTSLYRELRKAVSRSRAKFLYETNVGAGLPIIGTLSDLKKSGDKIEKIEAVLSGTLSYIFSTLSAEKPFSEVVRDAKAKGYTEPDPRDDLSGMDFARKFLILSREMGREMEFSEVAYENLVPEDCRDVKTVDAFFDKLKTHDEAFADKIKAAAEKNCVLRYIGKIENGKATIGLAELDMSHPIATLRGTENIVAFTTERYHATPLIVRGPGAGAEVTAGGVFADILRISNYLS
jgi:aspartokinase/homoserine dehydrogenase 1